MDKIVSFLLLCKCDIENKLRGLAAQNVFCSPSPIPKPFLRLWEGKSKKAAER